MPGVRRQRQYTVVDQVDGGFLARAHQQHDRRDQLCLGEPVPVVGRVDQGGKDVGAVVAGAGRGPLPLDQTGEEIPHRGVSLGLRHRAVRRALGGGEDRGGPGAETRPVDVRYAEDLAHDDGGQRMRVGLHQVDGAERLHRVQESGGHFADPGPHRFDAPHGECLADQLAQPGVVRRVGVRDVVEVVGPVARFTGDVSGVPQLFPGPGGVLGEAGVGEDLAGFGVAEDEPPVEAVRFPYEVHDPLVAHLAVQRVRIGL